MDVAVAFLSAQQVAWYENPLSSSPWPTHVMATGFGAKELVRADFDRNGTLDFAVGSPELAFGGNDELVFLQATAGGYTPHSYYYYSFTAVDAADLDGDGDMDAVTSTYNGDAVDWWENVHGGAGCGAITMAPSSLPGTSLGLAYSQTISASGGTAPYLFAISAGNLPSGLTLSGGGLISGTPSEVGSRTFTVTVTDGAGCQGSHAYTISVGGGLDFVVGEGLGSPNDNRVRVFDASGTPTAVDFLAYAAGRWGTNVASAGIDATPRDEILTGPGPGDVYGPQARAFTSTSAPVTGVNFFAYGTLKFGVNVAGDDIDGDAFGEVLTGAGPGSVFGPHVRGWNYDGSVLLPMGQINLFAYATPRFGVNVEGGDVDDDSSAELLTGPGPGSIFGPQVRGWNTDGGPVSSIAGINFNAFGAPQYGANIASGDVDADSSAEIVATPGPGPTLPARFVGFDYAGAVTALAGFETTPFASSYGGRVGLGDITADGVEDLLSGAGRDPSADSSVLTSSYDGVGLNTVSSVFVPFGSDTYGVNVVAGDLGY